MNTRLQNGATILALAAILVFSIMVEVHDGIVMTLAMLTLVGFRAGQIRTERARVSRLASERGFGLLAVMVTMVVMSLMVTVMLQSSMDSQKASYATRSSGEAFYAAEAGWSQLWDDWKPGTSYDNAIALLGTGDTVSFTGTPVSGGTYHVVVLRVDNDSTSTKTYFVRSEGRAKDGLGRREVGVVFQLPTPSFDVVGALSVNGNTNIGGSATIDGTDQNPLGWNSCSAPVGGVAAVVVSDVDSLSYGGGCSGGSCITGEVTDTLPVGLGVGTPFDELVGYATLVLPSATYNGIAPSYVGGECNVADPNNWGEVNSENDVCSSYFPLIYVQGDLQITGGRGQGILLVEGDLTIAGAFEFAGIVIIKGTLSSSGTGPHFTGGIVVLNENNEANAIAGNVDINHSNCAIDRAQDINLGVVKVPRSWVELR